MTEERAEVPISALQHFMFCPRQCGLIHIDRLWEENFLTAKGRQMHEKAHSSDDETRDGVKICRSVELVSERLHILGVSDVVEYHSDGVIVPVEYKRGSPKEGKEDEIQLCAQALCLEEMHGITVNSGFIFYGETRRRLEVIFDDDLRGLTEDIVLKTAELITSGHTPSENYHKKCRACSLYELCLPKMPKNVTKYIVSHIEEEF